MARVLHLLLLAWLAAGVAAEDGPPEDDYAGPPPSEHEHPRDVPTKPQNYQAPGHWATPPPESGIQLGFVPQRLYAQVRHSDTVKHLPRSAALAEARTAEEVAAAPRLREVLKSKKVSEVYSEEGYEDSAYDHAGHEKNSEQEEDYERHEDARKKPTARRRRPHSHDQYQEGSQRVESARVLPSGADLDAAAAIAAPVVRHRMLHKASLVMSVEDSDAGRRPNKLVAGYTHVITHPSQPPAPFASRAVGDRVSVAASTEPPVYLPRKSQNSRILEPVRMQNGPPVSQPRKSENSRILEPVRLQNEPPVSQPRKSENSRILESVRLQHGPPLSQPRKLENSRVLEPVRLQNEQPVSQPRTLENSRVLEPARLQVSRQQNAAPINTNPRISQGNVKEQSSPDGPSGQLNPPTPRPPEDGDDSGVGDPSKWEPARKSPLRASRIPIAIKETTQEPKQEVEARKRNQQRRRPVSHEQSKNVEVKTQASNSPPTQNPVFIASKLKQVPVQHKVASEKKSQEHKVTNRPSNFRLAMEDRFSEEMTPSEFSKFIADAIGTKPQTPSSPPEQTKDRLPRNHATEYRPITEPLTAVTRSRREATLETMEMAPSELSETIEAVETVIQPTSWRVYGHRDSDTMVVQQASAAENVPQLLGENGRSADSVVDPSAWAFPDLAPAQDSTEGFSQQVLPQKFFNQPYWYPRPFSLPESQVAESRIDLHIAEPEQDVVADDQNQEAQQLKETKVLQPVTWPNLDGADEILIFIKTKSRASNDTSRSDVAPTVSTPQLEINKTVNSSSSETLETVSSTFLVQNPTPRMRQRGRQSQRRRENNNASKSSPYLSGAEARRNSRYNATTDSVTITDSTPGTTSNKINDSHLFRNITNNSSSEHSEAHVDPSKHSRLLYNKTESPDDQKQSAVESTIVSSTASEGLRANDTEGHVTTTVASQWERSSNREADTQETLPTINAYYDKESITAISQPEEESSTDADHLLEALKLDSSSFGVRKSAPRSRHPNVQVEKVTDQTAEQEKYAAETTTGTIPQSSTNHNETEDGNVSTEPAPEERVNETDSDFSLETLNTDSTSYRRWQPTPYSKHPSLPLESSLELAAEQEPLAVETALRPDTRSSEDHSKGTETEIGDGSATKSQVRERGRRARLRISARYTAANTTTTPTTVPQKGDDERDVSEPTSTEASLRRSLQVIPLKGGRIPQYDALEQNTTAHVYSTTDSTVSTTPEPSDFSDTQVTESSKEDMNVKETANFGEYFSSQGFWGPIQHLVQETVPVVKYLHPKSDTILPVSTTTGTSSVEASPTTTETANSTSNKSEMTDALTESLGKPRIITASTLQYHQVPPVNDATARILVNNAHENSSQQANITAQLTSAQFSLPHEQTNGNGSHTQRETLNATEFQGVAYPHSTMASNISEGLSETQATVERHVSGKDGRYHKVIGRRPTSSSFVVGDAEAAGSSEWASYLERPLQPQGFSDSDTASAVISSDDESEPRADGEKEEEPTQEAQDRQDYVDDTEEDDHERSSDLEEDSEKSSPAAEHNESNREKRRYLESEEEEQRLEEEEKKLDAEKDREVEEEKKEWVEALKEIDHPKIIAPFNSVKYPFYYGVPRGTLSAYSPIRYALNPHAVPQKTEGGMEFYDSREDMVHCPEVTPNLKNVVPKRRRPGEWNKSPVPKNLPRLRGLGDKIDCLKVKYWGAEPLDSPFFKEDEIGKQEGASSSQVESLRADDSTGFYSEILGNIRDIQALGNIRYGLQGSDSSSAPSIGAQKYQNQLPQNSVPANQNGSPNGEVATSDGRKPPVPAEVLTPPKPVIAGGRHHNPQTPTVILNSNEKPQPLPARILYPQQKHVPLHFPDTSSVRTANVLHPQKNPNVGPVTFVPTQFPGYAAIAPQLGYVGISPPRLQPTQTPAQTQLLVEQLLAQVPSRARSEHVIGLRPPPLPAATTFVASPTLPRIVGAAPHGGLLMAAAPFEDSMASDSHPMGEEEPMQASASDAVEAVVSAHGEAVPALESWQPGTEWIDQQATSSQLVEQSRRVVLHEQMETSPAEDDQVQAAPKRSRRKESRAHRTTMETTQKLYRHYDDGGEGQEVTRRGRGHRKRQRARPQEYEAPSGSTEQVERPRNRRPKAHRGGRRNNLIQSPAEPQVREYIEENAPVGNSEGRRGGRRNNLVQSSTERRGREYTEASIPVESPEVHRGGRRTNVIQSSAEPRRRESTEASFPVEAKEVHRGARRNNLIQSSPEPRGRESTEASIPTESPEVHRGGRRNNVIQNSVEPRGRESTEANIPPEAPEGHREGRRNNLQQSSAEPRRRESTEASIPVESSEVHRGARRNNVIQSSAEPGVRESTEASIPTEYPVVHRGGRRNNLIQSSPEPRGRDYTEATTPVGDSEGRRGGRRNNFSSADQRGRDSTEASIPEEVPTTVDQRGRPAERRPTSWSYDKRRGEPRYEDFKADIYSKNVVAEADRRNSDSSATVSGQVPTTDNESQKAVINTEEISSEGPMAVFHVTYTTGSKWGKRGKSRDDTGVDRESSRLKDDSRPNDISTPYYKSDTVPKGTGSVPTTNTVEKLKDLGLWLSPSQINNVISSFISNHQTLLDSTSELPDQSNYITESPTESTTAGPQKLTSSRRNIDRNLVGAPRANTDDIPQATTEYAKSLRVTGRKSSVFPEVVTVTPIEFGQATTEYAKRVSSGRKSSAFPEVVTVTPAEFPQVTTEYAKRVSSGRKSNVAPEVVTVTPTEYPQVTTEYAKSLRVSSGRKSSAVPELVTTTFTPHEIPQTTTEFVKSMRLVSVRKSNVVPELVTSTVTPPDYYSTKRRKRPKYKKVLPYSVTENYKVQSFRETAPTANHAGQRYYTSTSRPQYESERTQVVSEDYPAVTSARQKSKLPITMRKRKYELLNKDNAHETTTEGIAAVKDRLKVTQWQKQDSMKVDGSQEVSTEGTVERKQNLPDTHASRWNSLRARDKVGSDVRRDQYASQMNDDSQPVSSTEPTVWTGDKQITEAVPTEKLVRNKYRQPTDQRRRQNEYQTGDSVRKDRPAQRLVQVSAAQPAGGRRSQYAAGVAGEATADGEATPRRVQWRPKHQWNRLPAPRNQVSVPEEPATEATQQTKGQRGRARLANDIQRPKYSATTTVVPPSTTEPSRRIKAVEHRRVTKEEIFTRTYIPDDNLADELVEQSERDIVIEPYHRRAEEEDEEEEEDIFEPFESLHFESDYVMYPENRLSEKDEVDSTDDYDDEYDAYDEYDEEDPSTANGRVANSDTKDTPGTSDSSNDRETPISLTNDEISKENSESSTTTPSLSHKSEDTLTTQRSSGFTRRVDRKPHSETDSEEFPSTDVKGVTKSVQGTENSKSESGRSNTRTRISAQDGKEIDTVQEGKVPSGIRARTSNDQTTTEQTTATTASVEKSRDESSTTAGRSKQTHHPSRRFPVDESATDAPDSPKKQQVRYHAESGDGQRRKHSGHDANTNAGVDYTEPAGRMEEVTTTEAPRRKVYIPTIPPYREPTTRRAERRQGTRGSMISYTVDTETGVGLWLPEGVDRVMERRPKASRLPWKERTRKNENKEVSGGERREDGTSAEIRNRNRNLRRQNGAEYATDRQTEELKRNGSEEIKLITDTEVQEERNNRAGVLRKQEPTTGSISRLGSVSTAEDVSDENSTLPEGLRGKPNGEQLYKAYMASLHDASGTSDVTDSPPAPEAEEILSEHQVFLLSKILSALPPRQRAGIVRGMVTGLHGDSLADAFEKDRVKRSHNSAEEVELTPVERTVGRITERREGT